MATSRGQTPPVNLKERIAALQQRSVSPNTHQSAQATPRGLPGGAVTGGLRDKIAKFEEKGGMPVPRGSFAMGAPQLAENAPPKKRGELYGNRVPGLGKPSGAPVGRSGSHHPSTDESPGPRKRCISTGAALSNGSSNFATDEPVPPLPNGLSGSAPRRNSLAINFGSGRRVMSTSNVEDKGVGFVNVLSPSSSPLVSENPPETIGSQSPSPEPVVGATLLEVEEPQPSSPQAAERPLEQPPSMEQPSLDSKVDAPAEDPPASQTHPLPVDDVSLNAPQSPTTEQDSKDGLSDHSPPASQSHPFLVDDASLSVSQSPITEQDSKDGLSDYESAPQSALSQPYSSLPEPTSSVPCSVPNETPSASTSTPAPAETIVSLPPSLAEEVMNQVDDPQDSAVASPALGLTQSAISQLPPSLSTSSVSYSVPDKISSVPTPTPTRAETVVISPSTSAPEEVMNQVDDSAVATSVSVPTISVPPSIPTPNLSTQTPPQSKPNFKAVVHRKVTELPVAPTTSNLVPSATPQLTWRRRGVSGNSSEVSPIPDHGDLAVLLEDAALLELRLTEGGSAGLKSKVLLATTPTNATFEPDPRHASASTLTEHASVPLVNSGSQSMRSVSIPSIREPLVDGEIPEGDETDGRSLASTTFSQRSPSHRKYLSNIYRLTGRRTSGYMPGSYPRDSMSMSSEDSSPVTTPSDNGKRKGFGIPWPSGSPKKGGSSIGRSSSFADKIFNRNRTKSNVSTAEQVSERGSLYESSQPTLSLSFPSELSAETRHPDSLNVDTRPTSWMSPGDSNSEFSPASSLLDNDIFDAFPSVPQTLPPGFQLDAGNPSVGFASTLPVNGRKQVNQRLDGVKGP